MAIYRTHAPYHKRYRLVDDVMVIEHPLYRVWGGMKDRCNNVDNPAYGNYGGRGITVCQEWDTSFETFANDMGMKPSPWHSLDRRNNDAGYSASNCRWATRAQQMRNRRKFKSNTSGETGIIVCKNGTFIARYDDNLTRYNLGRFTTISAAVDYRSQFIELLDTNHELAMRMTERRARFDSSTKILGITKHTDGFMVRRTVAGDRVFVGLADTLDKAIAMRDEFDMLTIISIDAALDMVANRPRSHNKSGIRGISKKGDGFTIRKTIDGKRTYLGYRATIEEAEELWKAN